MSTSSTLREVDRGVEGLTPFARSSVNPSRPAGPPIYRGVMDTNNAEPRNGLSTPTSKSAADPDTDATPTVLGPGGFTTPEPIPRDTSE